MAEQGITFFGRLGPVMYGGDSQRDTVKVSHPLCFTGWGWAGDRNRIGGYLDIGCPWYFSRI